MIFLNGLLIIVYDINDRTRGINMLTVSSLLSNPLLQNFRIAAGRNGLNNTISSTGYFEYEQDNDIAKTFTHGEFVITTLFAAKDDVSISEKALKLLINNRVSAIAIKDVYFDDVSDEIKAYADRYDVPVLFFSETYIDDLIVLIHNKLSSVIQNVDDEKTISALISDTGLDDMKKEELMKNLNRFFCSDTIFAAYISNDADIYHISEKSMKEYASVFEELNDIMPSQIGDISCTHAFIAYKRGLFLINTCNSSDEQEAENFAYTMERILHDSSMLKKYRVGIAAPVHGLSDISALFLEAIYANTSCLLRDRPMTQFQDTGTDSLLLPQIYTSYYKQYYSRTLQILSSQDNSASPLLDTVLEFVDNGGNIEKTANALFQHKNTIRYRINKISGLLGTEDEISLFNALHIFSTIYKARKYLDTFFK